MKNQLKTIALLGTLGAAFVAVGSLFGDAYMYGALALALIFNAGAYFFSDRVVLAMHHATEVSPAQAPRLHRMVEDLSRGAEIPKPRVFVMDDPTPNAFATGRNPEHGVVAVTHGLMRLLDERELRGVLAHEIAHIKNRDILVATIAAAISAAITYLAHAAQLFALFGGMSHDDDEERSTSPLAWLVTIIVAPIAATLIQLGISRSREFLADEEGARLCGDPDALANALLRIRDGVASVPHHREPATASLFIISPFSGSGGWLGSLFSTHPSTEDRVLRLRAMRGRGATISSHRQRRPLRPPLHNHIIWR